MHVVENSFKLQLHLRRARNDPQLCVMRLTCDICETINDSTDSTEVRVIFSRAEQEFSNLLNTRRVFSNLLNTFIQQLAEFSKVFSKWRQHEFYRNFVLDLHTLSSPQSCLSGLQEFSNLLNTRQVFSNLLNTFIQQLAEFPKVFSKWRKHVSPKLVL